VIRGLDLTAGSLHQLARAEPLQIGLAAGALIIGRGIDLRPVHCMRGKWLAPAHNMFKALPATDRAYIDTLAAIRNFVVHGSDGAQTAYKRELRQIYGIHSAPQPDEFLYAQDNRAASPARYEIRFFELLTVLERAITNS
jgi:hypothetical protein